MTTRSNDQVKSMYRDHCDSVRMRELVTLLMALCELFIR